MELILAFVVSVAGGIFVGKYLNTITLVMVTILFVSFGIGLPTTWMPPRKWIRPDVGIRLAYARS